MKNQMSREDAELASWIAERLVSNLRARHPLTATLCRAIYNEQVVQRAREVIKESDFKWIKEMCDSAEEDVCRLGLSLMRPLARLTTLQGFLELWIKWNKSYAIRAELLHRIADFQDLPIATHKELFGFVVNDWKSWIDAVREWTGGSHNVIAYCRKRVSDSGFPASKHWVYLCSAVAAEKPEEAREFLNEYMKAAERVLPEEILPFIKEEILPEINEKLKTLSEAEPTS